MYAGLLQKADIFELNSVFSAFSAKSGHSPDKSKGFAGLVLQKLCVWGMTPRLSHGQDPSVGLGTGE